MRYEHQPIGVALVQCRNAFDERIADRTAADDTLAMAIVMDCVFIEKTDKSVSVGAFESIQKRSDDGRAVHSKLLSRQWRRW
ncbi:hypothetical protein RHIZ404_220757 [Rhizobium sp. EC-SD404]|nr:hypothetical protein RHIZ404_220757 [Rhizobium sp. EC-SD404]